MEGFDRRGQIRDPKTGKILVWQPYTEHIRKEGVFLERPKNSGNLFYEDGTPAGRMNADRKIELKASHIAMMEKKSDAQKIHAELSAKDAQIADLEAKLIAQEVAPVAEVLQKQKGGVRNGN
jgi:hypothetical protein